MEEFLLFFLIIFVFFISINKLYKKGEVITIKSTIDGHTYLVRKLPDAKEAANLLAKINQKIQRLLESLIATAGISSFAHKSARSLILMAPSKRE